MCAHKKIQDSNFLEKYVKRIDLAAGGTVLCLCYSKDVAVQIISQIDMLSILYIYEHAMDS